MTFHVVLFATPEEDMSSFSFTLNQPLNFPKDEVWNVAVSEISLSDSLYNVQNDFIKIERRKKIVKFTVPDGLYQSYRDFQQFLIKFEPKYDRFLTETEIKLGPSVSIQFSKNLSKVLGLPEKIKNKNSNVLSLTPNIFPETKFILVLSNIVEDRMFGEKMLPVLTTVVATGKNLEGAKVTEPSPMEYILVKPGRYSEITIRLQRTDGLSMKFMKNFFLIRLKFVRL